jgi:selenocysteine-specific elongation factor
MVQPVKSVVLGTAGHIDHGKTALLRALTGIDADRLPEEKRRGITIDLGFAFLDAVASTGLPIRISFVDVPGHSLFIHNMLAGAGCIAAVILVVSAEEGVKPQTVEHLAICELLGVRTGLTVITKIDAVDRGRAMATKAAVEKFLSGSFLGDGRAKILTVSALTGENLDVLRQELVELAERSAQSDVQHLARLPIDRAFTVKGFGTVVTGTLLSGELQAGQSLALEPGGSAVRVRGLQNHGRAEASVPAGARVAVNLAGVEVAEISRGQTLVLPKSLSAVRAVDVEAWLLPGVSPLRHGSEVHFHAFTSNTVANVLIYGGGNLEPGSKRLLRIKLNKPIVLTEGDPFVLRQVSPAATIGGGRVLDASPLPKQRRGPAQQWLEQMRGGSREEKLYLRIARRGTAGLSLQRLMEETGLGREFLRGYLQPLSASHRITQAASDLLLESGALAAAKQSISGLLQQHPGGLKRSEFRSKTSLRTEVLDFSLDLLTKAGLVTMRGETVLPRQSAGNAAIPDPALAALASLYQQAGLAAPLVSEVAVAMKRREADVRRLITLLLRERVLVPMGSENLFVHQEALARLRSEISSLRGERLDVGRFKQITGLSRKYAIPLLEYLDRQMITRKVGESRLVL